MSTFEESKSLYSQEHFTIIEIDLPVVEGECTVNGVPGFGTPLSCDQPSNATKTYKFTTADAPLLDESGILRIVTRISETPTEIKSGKGLASRGSISVTMADIKGDPNPFAPAVVEQGEDQGTFLAKLSARNELANKPIRIKNYRVEADRSIDLENGAETRHYIIDSMNYDKKGTWTFKGKDELSRANIDETVWPLPLEGFLVNDINDAQNNFNVDPNVNYQIGDTLRIGDELMKVTAVSNIGTGAANINVQTRGADIVYSSTLSKTKKDSHSAGDEIFVCEVSNDERIDDLLERILLDIGIDASFIPKADWTTEINEWHPLTKVNTLWIESLDTSEVLERVLTDFMVDMWFDPVDREIKISAISAWQESTAQLTEGNQIDFESVSKKAEENLRATRALAIYGKKYLATSDSIENFSKASLFKRTELESSDLFGEPKIKNFELSSLLDKDAADLLVNRWVNRYSKPFTYTWTTQERKLTFKTGDVVDKLTSADVGFNGLPSNTSRSQIVSIRPNYRKEGRDYTVKALSYEPLFVAGSEIVVTGQVTDINLYTQYAGAPSQSVTLTFVFDNVTGGGTSTVIPAIRAGNFPSGSKLIIILANGTDLQGKGGNGGEGGGIIFIPGKAIIDTLPSDGLPGGVVLDLDGVDADIYFSGATPSSSYPIADGFIRAPSGGDGGYSPLIEGNDSAISGSGGNGGNGRLPGAGGSGGEIGGEAQKGSNGLDGTTGAPYGEAGQDNNASGGAAGKGVVDNGGTVVFFGETPERYVNGTGDH